MHQLSRNMTIAIVAGTAVALTLAGLARAVTDTEFLYATAQARYYSISPMSLRPTSGSTGYSVSDHLISTSPPGTYGCFATGLNLPDHAKITELRVWSATPTNMGVQAILFRSALADFASDALANMTSHNTSGARFAMATALPADKTTVVSNGRYNYGFQVCLSGNGTQFFSGRIIYTYTSAGD